MRRPTRSRTLDSSTLHPRPLIPALTALAITVALAAAPGAGATGLDLPTLTPTLAFEEEAVVVGGLTAGGQAAVFGVGLGMDGFMTHRLEVWDVVAADDRGVARFELGRPVPAHSSWAAVDLDGGAMALGAPAGTGLDEVAFPATGIDASLASLSDERVALAVLWVRPAALGDAAGGAWAGEVRDGGELDDDGAQDRRLSARLAGLQPLGTSPEPPAGVTAGDVLVGIDPDSLQVYGVRLVQ